MRNIIEQNIIITESCSNLRTLGRNALEGKWKVAIVAVLIYVLVLNFPPAVFDALFGVKFANLMTNSGYTYGMDANLYSSMYNSMPSYSILSIIYIVLIVGALELGQAIFFLASFRKHDVKSTDIFLGFERFGKALGLMLYQSLFIMLWTFLFIVPGIIASIRYSQAFFILADDPDKSIIQCMDESKAMMRGNKGKYFILTLSFIGWALLSGIPAGIVSGIGNVCTDNQFVISLFTLLGSLLYIPLTVYITSTFTGFYEILAGHLIKETRPVPVTIQEAVALKEELEQNPNQETSVEPASDNPSTDDNDEMSDAKRA